MNRLPGELLYMPLTSRKILQCNKILKLAARERQSYIKARLHWRFLWRFFSF